MDGHDQLLSKDPSVGLTQHDCVLTIYPQYLFQNVRSCPARTKLYFALWGRFSATSTQSIRSSASSPNSSLRIRASPFSLHGGGAPAAPSAGACFWFSQCLPRGGRCDGCESRIYCVVLDMTLVQHPRLLWCSTPGYSMLMVQHPRLQHAYSTAPPRGATQCKAPSATSSVVQSKHPRLP